jgi:hypothetical protein
MLGLFKKPLPLLTVLGDLLAWLDQMRKTVDGIAADEAINTAEDYPFEAAAFVYVLGWHTIQISDLSRGDKHRFSAELTGAVAEKLSPGVPDDQVDLITVLQERMSAYRDALEHGTAQTSVVQLVLHFLEYLGADTPEYVAVQAALYALASNYLSALRDFLTGVNKSHKFV